ncbi:MAG: hypothetical protein ACT4OV_01710 [Microthrixaceae bacterium]
MVFAWFAVGLVAAPVMWVLLRGAFAADVFARSNVNGRTVPTAVGVVLAVAAVVVEGAVRLAEAAGLDLTARASQGRHLALVLAVGMGLLGLLDDLGGAGESGGFRGHLLALARGRLTTGALKLFGGAALSLAVVSAIEPHSTGRLLLDGALVALTANLANLLDRAPGRAIKAGLIGFVCLLLGAGASPELAGVAFVVGGAAGLLWPDVREELMLGDAGANVLGALLGLGVVLTVAPQTRSIVLGVVVALNLLSEVVSFSGLIERIAPLRALDRLGRRA